MTPNTVQVGETIYTWQQFRLLPVGTEIQNNSDSSHSWVKQEDGRWANATYPRRDHIRAEGNFNLGHMKVASYSQGSEPDPAPLLTLRQYQHRFRDWSLAAQEMYGVSYAPVERALAELGCGLEQFAPGPGMVLENTRDRERLPIGTVVLVGEPENYERFGLFVKGQWNEWELLLGTQRSPDGQPLVIESMPEIVETGWLTAVGTEAEQEEILTFKQQAWLVASKLQQTNRWCPTFNHAVARMGISEKILEQRSVNGVSVGDIVNAETASRLPVGTVFRCAGLHDRVVWYHRVLHGSPNSAGTRRIFGYSPNPTAFGHFNQRMEVMWLPGGQAEMALDVDIVNAHPHLPIGTRFRYNNDHYLLCQDRTFIHDPDNKRHQTVPASGTYELSIFLNSEQTALRVCEFGTPS